MTSRHEGIEREDEYEIRKCVDFLKKCVFEWIRTEAITRHLFTTFPALIAGNIVLIAVNVVVDIFHICM